MTKLQGKLPGEQSWQRMAPEGRMHFPHEKKCPDAGVMLLLYPEAAMTHIVFIKRNEYAGPHSAQISFPGGMKEDVDPDLVATALRETEEEVGVPAGEIEILGSLTPLLIPVSNICVHPFVGWLNRTPEFRPDRSEVQYLICPAIAHLLDHKNHRKGLFNRKSEQIITPYIDIDGEMLWGATAMMFSEFMALLGY
ncbi:MAG: CoA pyrophosphatase [Bacteroidales bacterium]|nr:CoA pyrophosphatase [Bacteroidales bacterium]